MRSREDRHGTRVAFIVTRPGDAERLLAVWPDHAPARCSSVTVIGIAPATSLLCAYASLSGMTTPAFLERTAAADAARVARQAVDALPPDVDGRHLACPGWNSASFLSSLRDGAFDLALFASWPALWPQRSSIRRAARAGGTTLVRVGIRR